MQLIDFPIEILQEIVHHIDDAGDVLSLGLTCSRLKSVTIPFPLQYRQFTWPTHDGTFRLNSTAVKDPNPFGELSLACEDFLSSAPGRWKAIRGISVYKWGTSVAPSFMRDYVRSEAFVLPKLPDAVYESMTAPALNPHELVQRGNARHILMGDNVARVLARTPWLSSLDWQWFPPELDSPIWRVLGQMQHIHKLTFIFNTDLTNSFNGASLSTITARLVQVIAGYKGLESLTINVPIARNGHHDPTWSFDPIYDVTWPSLRQLDLSHTRINSAKRFMDFLSRHDRLEQLRISESIIPSVQVQADQLPHLVNVDVPNFRLARTLVQQTPARPDAQPVYGLRIQSALSKTDFKTLLTLLPSMASNLQTLNINLSNTSVNDLALVLDAAPSLVRLEITGHEVMDVLAAARRLRCKQTRQALNSGPMREWKNIRFPLAYAHHLDRWADAFRKAPRLKTLLLRCLAAFAAHDKPAMYDDSQSLSLSDAFRSAVPGVGRVQTQVMQGRDLGLLITCWRSAGKGVEHGELGKEE